MTHLTLIGIGTGNPDHLTGQAIAAMNAADLVLIPEKGMAKADLADLRRAICARFITNPAVRVIGFAMPVRAEATPGYLDRVNDWHDAIAATWRATIDAQPGPVDRVALLVWGDPSLYDSTLRIAARLDFQVTVVPGLTSLQLLTAAHAIPLNTLGEAFLVTTGRKLREAGFPAGIDTVAVMLDGENSFASVPSEGLIIFWGAYLGMPEQVILSGPLSETGPRIVQTRAEARARHGWIMDIYLLRRE